MHGRPCAVATHHFDMRGIVFHVLDVEFAGISGLCDILQQLFVRTCQGRQKSVQTRQHRRSLRALGHKLPSCCSTAWTRISDSRTLRSPLPGTHPVSCPAAANAPPVVRCDQHPVVESLQHTQRNIRNTPGGRGPCEIERTLLFGHRWDDQSDSERSISLT